MQDDQNEATAERREECWVPLTARASIDARMNPRTASNAVFWERNRRSRAREVGLRIRVLASRVVVGMACHLSELRLLPVSPIRSAVAQ
jgi:hypothetical protein